MEAQLVSLIEPQSISSGARRNHGDEGRRQPGHGPIWKKLWNGRWVTDLEAVWKR